MSHVQVNELIAGRPRREARSNLVFLGILALLGQTLVLSVKREVGFDEAVYLMGGRSFFAGEGFAIQGAKADVSLLPMYGICAGALQAIGAGPVLADAIVHAVSGVVIVLAIYQLGTILFSRRVGWYAALLAIAIPALAVTVLYSGTHSLFMALGLVALLLALDAFERQRPRKAFLSGLFLGVGYLTRADGLVWFAAFITVLVVNAIVVPGRNSWRNVAALAIGFGLLFMPFSLHLRSTTGETVGGRAYDALVGMAYTYPGEAGTGESNPVAANRARAELGLNANQRLGIVEVIRRNPDVFALRAVRNTRYFFEALPSLQVVPFVLLPFAGIGVWKTVRDGTLTRWRIAWLLAGSLPVCVYIMFGIQHRYLVPAVPVILLCVAAGVDVVIKECPAGSRFHPAILLWVILAVLVGASTGYLYYQRAAETAPATHAQDWARAITEDARVRGVKRPTVVTSISKVPLYAGLHVQWIDTAGPADLATAKRFFTERAADYWLLLPSEQTSARMNDRAPWLVPILKDEHGVIIFRIDRSSVNGR
jgi:hypothetical protein